LPSSSGKSSPSVLDKIAATRRKGKWTGGPALLGYDLDSHAAKLKVNPKEAARVRAIFELYLQYRALGPTVRELARRRWRTKQRHNCDGGDKCGGRRFTRPTLHRLLTNVTYTGKVRYQNEVYAGEHPALVPLRPGNACRICSKTIAVRFGGESRTARALCCRDCFTVRPALAP
jgi:hypothetical protein